MYRISSRQARDIELGLALNRRPGTGIVRLAAGGTRGPSLRLRSRSLIHFNGFTPGKIFGQAAGSFVTVLIKGDQKLAVAARELLVECANDVAADAFGFAVDANVIGPPVRRHFENKPIFARAFEQVARRRFDLEEQGIAAIERAAGSDGFEGRQQLIFDARLFGLSDAGAGVGHCQ